MLIYTSLQCRVSLRAAYEHALKGAVFYKGKRLGNYNSD